MSHTDLAARMLTAGKKEKALLKEHFQALREAMKEAYGFYDEGHRYKEVDESHVRLKLETSELHMLKTYFKNIRQSTTRHSCISSSKEIKYVNERYEEINRTRDFNLTGLKQFLEHFQRDVEKHKQSPGWFQSKVHPLLPFLEKRISLITRQSAEIEAERKAILEERTQQLRDQETEIKLLTARLEAQMHELHVNHSHIDKLETENERYKEHTADYSKTLQAITSMLDEAQKMATFKKGQEQAAEMGEQITSLQRLRTHMLSVVGSILAQLTAMGSQLDIAMSNSGEVSRALEQTRLNIQGVIGKFEAQSEADFASERDEMIQAAREDNRAKVDSHVVTLKEICQEIQRKYTTYHTRVHGQWFRIFRKGRRKLNKLKEINTKASTILDELNGNLGGMSENRPFELFTELQAETTRVFATLGNSGLSNGQFLDAKLDVEGIVGRGGSICRLDATGKTLEIQHKFAERRHQARRGMYEAIFAATQIADGPLQEMRSRIELARQVATKTQLQLQAVLDLPQQTVPVEPAVETVDPLSVPLPQPTCSSQALVAKAFSFAGQVHPSSLVGAGTGVEVPVGLH